MIKLGNDEEDLQVEENIISNEQLHMIPIDSSREILVFILNMKFCYYLERCVTDMDCGENMVCLSEFCECAKQKYKRIPGPRCITAQAAFLELNTTSRFSGFLALQ